MKTHRILAAIAIALAAGAACAQATIDHTKALAGGVTPGDAAGYPITISQPGHYKLMSNLLAPAETTAIEIVAPNVTLDLNGFTVEGPMSCASNPTTKAVSCSTGYNSTVHGIRLKGSADASVAGAVIRNGTVKGFSGSGVYINGGEKVENVRVTQNWFGIYGVQTYDQGVHVKDAVADVNGYTGFALYQGLLENCRAAANGSVGVSGITQLIVHNCLVRANKGVGIMGATVRGTGSFGNGVNRQSVTSLGGNIDGTLVY